MATDLEKATHGALKQAEVLLASEAPAYQVLPVVQDAIKQLEKAAPALVVEAEKKAGPEVTVDVAAVAATPTGKKAVKQVEAEAQKIEAEVIDEVEKVVGAKKKAPAKPEATK
jgi:hypothetical protein